MVGGAGAAAAAPGLATGAFAGSSAQAPAESAASVKAANNTFFIAFIEVNPLLFQFYFKP
jgi:hypothetical protein